MVEVRGIRTPDPLLAKQVLSRLSYTPICGLPFYHAATRLFDIPSASGYYIAQQIGPVSRVLSGGPFHPVLIRRFTMRGVAIVAPVRTAVATFGGGLRGVSAADLASLVIKESVERSGIDPARLDDVILGCGYPSGENPAIGRLAGLKADLPIEVPGYQLDRRCSSGLQAILKRRHAGADRERRRGGGRRRGEHEQCRILRQRGPAGAAASAPRPSTTGWCGRGRPFPRRSGSATFPAWWRPRRTWPSSTEIPRQEQDEYALRSHPARRGRPGGRQV